MGGVFDATGEVEREVGLEVPLEDWEPVRTGGVLLCLTDILLLTGVVKQDDADQRSKKRLPQLEGGK
ncbi:MAG: hypothetical protein EBY17_28450 [Acidobacteriia bacterium]|nr:hypothetical protein [Terriglobia bacterium]